jgi:hypothetical protein
MESVNKFYAGIGSRETPPGIEPMIEEASGFLGKLGFTLRSGGAPGADSMFEKYHKGEMEIYLPWAKFNDNKSPLFLDFIDDNIVKEATEIAKKYHPSWARLSIGAKKLMTRNTFQILGNDLKTQVEFVVCWTKGGTINSGTGQAMRIARSLNIPIFNLYHKDSLYKIKLYVNNLI